MRQPGSPASSRTNQLMAADRSHLWHPFTQHSEWQAEESLIIESGDGCWLVDIEGKRYLDGISSLWVNVHGHRVPAIDAAIAEQLGRIGHSTLLGQASVPSIELAGRLVALAPEGLSRVFYSDSGSTAVEVALKMAFQSCQQRGQTARGRFIAFTDAYHGDTVGSVSVGGMETFHGIYRPLLFDALRAPYPHPYRCPTGATAEGCAERCLAELDILLQAHGHEVCALIIEPLVQGAAGIITAPAGFLAQVARRCAEHGVLLICDEVATGFGRTGTLFACEQEQVCPDFLCLAKGLTGGYLPLAATLTTEAVYEAFDGPWDAHRTFYHGHSYTGNALGCAAALASLDLFESDDLLVTVRSRASHLRDLLRARLVPHRHVGDVRQRGLMVGIELVADRPSKRPFAPGLRLGRKVALLARERGVIVRPLGDVVVLMPPLAISEAELDLLVDAVALSVDAAVAEIG